MTTQFSLTEAESLLLEEFQKKHYKKCNANISVIFTQTGIAPHVEVRCNLCNEIKDISDYASW